MRGTFLEGSTEGEREELPDLLFLDLLRWLNKDISRALRESREAWCLRLPCADELLEMLLAVCGMESTTQACQSTNWRADADIIWGQKNAWDGWGGVGLGVLTGEG